MPALEDRSVLVNLLVVHFNASKTLLSNLSPLLFFQHSPGRAGVNAGPSAERPDTASGVLNLIVDIHP